MTSEQKKLTGQVLAGVLIVGFFITMVWERTITGGQIALLTGVAFGVIVKFLIPYILKTHEGTMTPFDVRYVWTCLITLVYMLPIGLLLAEQLTPIMLPTFALIFLGVALGIGSNWTTEKMVHIAILLKGLYSVYGAQAVAELITDGIETVPGESESPTLDPIEGEPALGVEGDVVIKELPPAANQLFEQPETPKPTAEDKPEENSGIDFGDPTTDNMEIGRGIKLEDKEEDDKKEPHWI